MVTTVTLEPDEDGQFSKMFLEQIAEKDCKYCNDSSVTWEANGDFLTMSLEVFSPHDPTVSVKAVRKFMRFKPGDKRNGSRKMSAPFWPMYIHDNVYLKKYLAISSKYQTTLYFSVLAATTLLYYSTNLLIKNVLLEVTRVS